MKAWVVGWNEPGRLPAIEPREYTSWQEAIDNLLNEVGYRALASGESLTDYLSASAALRNAERGVPLSFYYAGIVWWCADLER